MELSLDDLATFAEVVRAGSFAEAARRLGRPRQSIHRQVAALEARLGLQLVERSTRRLRVTDVGQRLFEHADRIRDEARRAVALLKDAAHAPSGVLRVTAPDLFGEVVLTPVIQTFLERWPDVRVEAVFSLDHADLLAEGFDLAIRLGSAGTHEHRTHVLARTAVAWVAAPSYLARVGAPTQLEELATLDYLHYGREPRALIDASTSTRMPRLWCTNARTVHDAAVAGLGVAKLPLLLCAPTLRSGALVRVLPELPLDAARVYAIHAARTSASPTLDAFLSVLRTHLEREPLPVDA
jgi:DNA-binding transcriptional LysR family regulator